MPSPVPLAVSATDLPEIAPVESTMIESPASAMTSPPVATTSAWMFTSPFSVAIETSPSVVAIAFSTLTATSPGSPVTVIATSLAVIPDTDEESSATVSVPSAAGPPEGSARTSVTETPPAISPTVTLTPSLLTTTLSVVSMATTDASVNVVTPSLLVTEPPELTTVPELSFLYVVPPPVEPMDATLSVMTFAVAPSATYATSPPTVAVELTFILPSVAWTYLSAAALTAAFSVIPFAAASVTLLPETTASTFKVALVDSRRMLPSVASTAPAIVTVSFETIRTSFFAVAPSTFRFWTAAGLLGSYPIALTMLTDPFSAVASTSENMFHP